MRPKGQIFDLKSFRAKYNLSQKKVAEDTHRKQSFLSAVESGRRSAPEALLNELVKLYGEENISDFLHEREEPTFGDVQNVNDAIVNSPGGTILIDQFGSKLSKKEILQIIRIQDEERSKLAEIEAREAEENAKNAAPLQGVDPTTLTSLVNLLTASEARNKEAESRIKILEAKVLELQAQLDANKKK